MTAEGLASEITYGAGGPSIPVKVDYTLTGGNPWKKLFGGAALQAGLVQTVANINTGAQIALKITGTYNEHGWLLFNASYRTDQSSSHVIILRDGDPLPSFLAYGNQEELQTLLAAYLDADHHMDLGPYTVIVLTELSTVTSPAPPSEDFQDAVILLRIQGAAAC